jgi:hypothetical protein
MMTRPVRLHLDTSDYSRMYLAKQGTPEAHIRENLKEMVRDGFLEIGLSYHIIFELLQKAGPEHKHDRIARARLLEELCGQNAFCYPSDLGQGHYFVNDGVWFPRSDLAFFDAENLVRDLIKTVTSHPQLSRGERRALSKRNHFVQWVNDDPARLRWLVSVQPWSSPLARGFIENGELTRYLAGKSSRAEANRQILHCFTNPVMIYETWFEHLGRRNPIDERRELFTDRLIFLLGELHAQMDQVNGTVPNLRAEIKKALSQYRDNPEAYKQFVKLDRDVKKFATETMSPQVLTKNTAEGWTKTVGEPSAFIAAQILYAFHYERRNIRRSDGVDMLHALYLPYTDLWRGDKAFSDLLIKHKVDFSERVVVTLNQLPSRIVAEISKLAVTGSL